MATNHRTIGQSFKTRRIKAGFKQAWMADQLGVCKSEMSMLENGVRKWKPETISKANASLPSQQ